METFERTVEFERVKRPTDGPMLFRGHAAVFGVTSKPVPGPGGLYREQVSRGAFFRAIAEGQDVKLVLNHDPNIVLARTTNGTLSLGEDKTGLAVEADIAETTQGKDVKYLLDRGDLNEMSFRFAPVKHSFMMTDTGRIRSLDDVDLRDVSIVTYPAYPATDASMEARAMELAMCHLRSGEDLTDEDRAVVRSTIEQLSALLSTSKNDPKLDPKRRRLELLERL